MKKLLLLLGILLQVSLAHSQINQYSQPAQQNLINTYVPLPVNEISGALQARQQQYDNNYEYWKKLFNWAYENKDKGDGQFQSEVKNVIDYLNKIQDKDLSVYGQNLKKVDNMISQSVTDVKGRVAEQNKWNETRNNIYQALERSDFKSALSMSQQMISNGKADAQIYFYQGRSYSGLSDFANAVQSFNTSIILDDSDSEFVLQIADMNFSLGHLSSALDKVNVVLSREPNNIKGLLLKARILSDQGDYPQSNETNKKLIELDPGNSMAYNNLGWNYFEQGNFTEALLMVNKALVLEPKNSVAWDSKADILYKLNKYNEAILAGKKGLEINPKLSNSHLVIGKSYLALKQKTNACLSLRKANELGNKEAARVLIESCL